MSSNPDTPGEKMGNKITVMAQIMIEPRQSEINKKCRETKTKNKKTFSGVKNHNLAIGEEPWSSF